MWVPGTLSMQLHERASFPPAKIPLPHINKSFLMNLPNTSSYEIKKVCPPLGADKTLGYEHLGTLK